MWPGNGREADREEFKRIDGLASSSDEYKDQKFGKWKQMQKQIVEFQRKEAIEEAERRSGIR